MKKCIIITLLVISIITATVASPQPLKLPGYIRGEVVNTLGEPLGGTRIEFYSGNILVKVVTVPANGVFTTEIKSGTYLVKFIKEGYVTKTIYIAVEPTKELNLGTIVLDNALKVSILPTSITLKPHQTIQLPLIVKNEGDVELSCIVNISTSSEDLDAKLIFSGTVIGSFRISARETKTFNLQITAPYKAGSYEINFSIVPSYGLPYNASIKVKVEKENVQFVKVDFPSKIYTAGSTAVFNILVSNPLDISAIATFEIISPKDWRVTLESTKGERISSVMLSPKEQVLLKIVCKIPEKIESGDYNITVRIKLYSLVTDVKIENEIPLTVIIEEIKPEVEVRVENPVVNAYSGSTATFEITLLNVGAVDVIIDLNVAGLPEGYSYRFKDQKGNVISSVYLGKGSSKKVYLQIIVPYGEKPHLVCFNFTATIKGLKEIREPLGVNVLGKYELDYETEIFSLEMPIGSTSPFQVVVKNTGANELTNVKLVLLKVPSGFNVTVNPPYYEVLKPGETCTFTLTITSSSDLSAGDYYITIKVVSNEAETLVREIRVSLYQRTEIVYIAFAVLVIVLIVITFIYHKYGRR